MKTFTTLAIALLFSSAAMAEEVGLTVGVGYQAGAIANSDDRNGDPAGFSVNFHYAIPTAKGIFVGLDLSDHEDEADNGLPDKITTEQERTAIEVGYVYGIDANTNIVASVNNADIEWTWEDGVPTNFQGFVADDSGISLVVGVDKKLGNGVSLGTALSLGFESGVEAYTSIAVIDRVNVTLSYFKKSYELDWAEFDELGLTGDGSPFGDGDFQFDTSGVRVSASYAF